MNERDIELAKQAKLPVNHPDWADAALRFAAAIRADEREKVVGFIQEYSYWLGVKAKQELISAIRARGTSV